MKKFNVIKTTILIDGDIEFGDINVGALTIFCDDRKYITDSISSDYMKVGNHTRIEVRYKEDRELFPEEEWKYNITTEDILNEKVKICLYVASSSNTYFNIKRMTTKFTVGEEIISLKTEEE